MKSIYCIKHVFFLARRVIKDKVLNYRNKLYKPER